MSPDAPAAHGPVDFAFLDVQTFADHDLQREVLDLFVAQARRIVPTLPNLTRREQGDTAHLLLGSARGIGAWDAAATAEAYEAADPDARTLLGERLSAAFATALAAIEAHLANSRS